MTKERQGRMGTSATAATANPEGFTDAEWAKVERYEAEKERRRTAAERERRGLTTKTTLRRNETGTPFNFIAGCTASADFPKEIRCDGSSPACRLSRPLGRPFDGPLAAPGELFQVPPGHRRITNPALPEIDPASVADEPAVQDRLALGELRSFEQRAEAPATQAARTLADLEAQRRILEERIVQQHEELARRQSHVDAAKAKTEEFLSSRSEAWREALLSGTAEASIEAAKRAADEAERRRPEVHTVDDIRRAQGGDVGPAAYTISASGQAVKLKVNRSS